MLLVNRLHPSSDANGQHDKNGGMEDAGGHMRGLP